MDELLEKIKKFPKGEKNYTNICYDYGMLIYHLIKVGKLQRSLEIGTSTGFGSVFFSKAMSETGGKHYTIDIDQNYINQAKKNIKELNLINYVDFILGDAEEVIEKIDEELDIILIDGDKNNYLNYMYECEKKLKIGGYILAHDTIRFKDELSDFVRYINDSKNYENIFLPFEFGMAILKRVN